MKRTTVSLIAAIVVSSFWEGTLLGHPTTAYEAEMVVRGWLRLDPEPLGMTLGRDVASVETFTDDTDGPMYYIVHLAPSGLVIVSADDLVEPIIGFAEEEIYDPSYNHPVGSLVSTDITRRVLSARAQEKGLHAMGETPGDSNRAKWRRLEALAESPQAEISVAGITSVSDVRVAPLIKTKWGLMDVCSDYCYNYYTPNHYGCGCVATGMAQLMYYHKYPNVAISKRQFPIWVHGIMEYAYTRGGDGNGGPYAWNLMVREPDCLTTLTQRQAIGALCYDAALAVETEWVFTSDGVQGLSAPSYARDALIDPFKYANAVIGWNDDANIGWGLKEMINTNLDANCPVILGITGGGGTIGHVVLADGYGYNSSTPYHHLNVGPNHDYDIRNIWYNVDRDPPSIDIPSDDPANPVRVYNSVEQCIYNIFPRSKGEIISGRITDASGNPISEAVVTAVAPSDPNARCATTNDKGIYAFVGVNSGSTYRVSAARSGFAFQEQTVSVGQSMQWDFVSGNRWGVDFVSKILVDAGILYPATDVFAASKYDNIHTQEADSMGAKGSFEVWQESSAKYVTAVVRVTGLLHNTVYRVYFDENGITPLVVGTAGPCMYMGLLYTDDSGTATWTYTSAPGDWDPGIHMWSVYINKIVWSDDKLVVNHTVLISENLEFEIQGQVTEPGHAP